MTRQTRRPLTPPSLCFVMLGAVLLTLLVPAPAHAQTTCGPGTHWIDGCLTGGTDPMSMSVAYIQLNTCPPGSCLTSFNLSGPTTVARAGAIDGPGNFGAGSLDGHIDVINTQMVSMTLTGSGITVIAGAGLGATPLAASFGVIVEHTGSKPGFPSPAAPDPDLGDSEFRIYLEIDMGGGVYLYNHAANPFIVSSVIDRVPPFTSLYTHPLASPIPLYDDPIGGTLMAELINAEHNTEIDLASFTATPVEHRPGFEDDGEWTLVRWRSGFELDNLGFNVYRDVSGQLERLNPSLVAGSALAAGVQVPLTAGRSYAWWDKPTTTAAGQQYWLEEIGIDGERTWHGPIEAASGGSGEDEAALKAAPLDRIEAGTSNALLLSELGRSGTAPKRSAPARPAPRLVPTPKSASPELDVQWALAAGPAIKLGIVDEGWYRIEQSELVAAGLDPLVDPRFLQVHADGVEQAIKVTGQEDGSFDPGDAVELYGLGLDTAWTDSRIYWLSVGSQPGLRIPRIEGKEPIGPTGASFRYAAQLEERFLYFGGLSNGDEENFFGQLVEPSEPAEHTLSLTRLDPDAPATADLEVVLQGVTTASHEVAVQLNGAEVGTVLFDGQEASSTSFKVDQSLLTDGANQVTLVARAGDQDVSLVDHIRVTYWHTSVADGDVLRFTANARERVNVDGFSTPDVQVLDITDPSRVVELHSVVERAGPSSYSVATTPAGEGARLLLAISGTAARQVSAVTSNHPSDWHASSHGADLLIVTHGSLTQAATALQNLRQGKGWSVELVDIEDVYDELGFGARTPYALRELLRLATTQWSPSPQYLLLLGDASIDPRDYRGTGKADLVPTKMVATRTFDSASDDWFGDLDGDGWSELAIGRIPAADETEASAVIAKLVAYENADASAPWATDVLLVSDDNDSTFEFELASDAVESALPQGLAVEKIYLGQSDLPTARAQLLDRLGQGQLLVNYVGHGGVESWAGEGLLLTSDVATLGNGPRLPLVITMSCSNGYFNSIFEESLAAALVTEPSGGAIAAWASSSLTLPARQMVMNHRVVEQLFADPRPTLGRAALAAKAGVADPDLRRTWILFGDPTLRLKGSSSGL